MPLKPGTMLGQYEILALIGVGGMGEVYRAHDTVLARDVALKLLPEQFARDPDRIARFRREARLLASLNHPNIAAIYGLEEDAGRHFLVMELVLGDTLRDRITRDGPTPMEEALLFGKQIAEALEAAHEKPIIHRDLKPANVKVTPEGKVKVLDFGLAKAFAGDESESDIQNAPTLTASPTIPGAILGTPAYMSPEQAKGKKVDKRADIWALGCVLYELLTGKQTFAGESVTEVLGAVLHKDPDWSAFPESTPHGIRVLLRRCLHKDPVKRFHSAADVAILIEETLTAPMGAGPTAVAPAPKLWRRAMPLSLAAVIALLFGIAIGVWMLRPAPPVAPAPAHVVIALPPGDRLDEYYPPVAFSPDGNQLVYVAIHNGVQKLFLRAMDSQEAKPLPGTEGSGSPFFSPDGQWVGFFAGGKLKKVSIAGGTAITLCDSGGNAGASWGPDDTIVFSPSNSSALMRVSAAGGTPQVLTTLDHAKGELAHFWPQFLPGGKALLFTVNAGPGWDEKHIAVLKLDTGERRIVLRGGHTGRFMPTGHLVYYRAGTLLAVPFDLARLEAKRHPNGVSGSAPITIAEGVAASGSTIGAEYSFSATGSLAYVPASPRQFERRLVWVDRKGEVEPIPAPQRPYNNPTLSPDGRQVTVRILSGTDEIGIYDLARGALTRISSGGGSDRFPIWTPDGKRITYGGTRAGFLNLFWRAADGTGAEERLTTGENLQIPESWSPDGKWLVFGETSPNTGWDIWLLRVEGDPGKPGQAGKPQPFLQTPFNENNSAFSPDGRWLAYRSDESGRNEVYVQPFPGPGQKWQVSTESGGGARWAGSGRELFYRNGSKMLAVDIQTEPTFTAGKPRLLFEGQFGNWDVAPDGQRFLMIQAVEPQQAATQINVILNWFEELKRRVPAAR